MEKLTFTKVLFCLMIFAISGQVMGQEETYPSSLTCVWDLVGLRENPKSSSKRVRNASKESIHIKFGEVVQNTGNYIKVDSEKRTYVQVQTADNHTGWVNNYLFVAGQDVGVILAPIRIYNRPNVPASITSKEFNPGEIVVLRDQVNEAGDLVSMKKASQGWVKNLSRVSFDQVDVELATLMKSAEKEKDSVKQKKLWGDLLVQAQEERAAMYDVLSVYYQSLYPTEKIPAPSSPQVSTTPRSPSSLSAPLKDVPIEPTTSKQPTPKPKPSTSLPPSAHMKPFWDENTNKWLTQADESGSLQILTKGPATRNLLLAAHKSLDKGTKVLVEIPGNQGYIEVKISDTLPNNSRQILGLSPESAKLIFGENIPTEVKIYYLVE